MKKEETLQHTLSSIGERLISLRKKKGYTSHEIFCYDHDLPRMQYWRMENGKTNLTLKSLHRILSIHGLSIEQFFIDLNRQLDKEQPVKPSKSSRKKLA